MLDQLCYGSSAGSPLQALLKHPSLFKLWLFANAPLPAASVQTCVSMGTSQNPRPPNVTFRSPHPGCPFCPSKGQHWEEGLSFLLLLFVELLEFQRS